MDGHHHSHAADAVHQQAPHNIDGLQNGLNWINYPEYPVDSSSHGFDSNWGFNQPDNAAATSSQSMPLYPAWQQAAVTDPALDPYGRQFSKSPAAQSQAGYQASTFNTARQHHASSVYDPALATSTYSVQSHLYPTGTVYSSSTPLNGTIAPNALENTVQRMPTPQRTYQSQPPVEQRLLLSAIPAGQENGHYTIAEYNSFSKATNSSRLGAFVNIGQADFEYPINKTVIPAAPVRRSRNELRRLAAADPRVLAKLGKKILKKSTGTPKVKKELKLQAPATKLVQTTAGVKIEVVSSSDDTETDTDSSDYDSDDEPDEPSPLPPKRDDEDLKEGIRYDTIKALWRPKRRVLPTTSIKNGLKDYWEILRTIRDRWKADTTALKEAEEKGKMSELPLLKSRVKDQRDMISVAFKTATEHGHRSILELSSENVPFLFLCYQFLQDRLLKDDVDGPLARAILEILAMCITLTEDKVNKTYLHKIWPRYLKKGNNEVKTLVKKIETAIKEGTKAAQEEQGEKADKDPKPQSPTTTKFVAASKSASDSVAGVKRALPPGSAPGQSAKRVASGGASGTHPKSEATKTITPAKKTPGVPTKIVSNSSLPAVKTKTTTSKPSSFFNAMQSTAKKPAALTAKPAASSVLATALKAAERKPAAASAAKAESASKPAFSFSSTMANLAKPKDKAPSPKPEQDDKPETPEQTAKRLRKEARRGLRVSFKPDSSIEEVRFFTHDPDEELGHDASMTRDVGDVGGEGRMFKQHKDMMDLEDEEDAVGEEEIKPWSEPGNVDFSDVEQEERDRNYEPFGGGQAKVDSSERTAREQYEANTLMVYYTDHSDIPPTPKEPNDDVDTTDASSVKQFGAPSAAVLERAAKLGSGANQSHQPPAAGALDISSILANLASGTGQRQQQQQPPQYTNPTPQAPPQVDLHALLSSTQPQQASTIPFPPQPQQAVAPDLAKLFSSLQGQHQPPPAPPIPSPQANQMSPDVLALFAQLQQTQQQGAVGPPIPPSFAGSSFPPVPPGFNYALPLQQLPTQPPEQNQQQAYPYENEERRRWREQQEAQNGQGKKKGAADRRFTQSCKFWTLGKCQKGDKCTYRHD
ncbi:hypothetical protein CAC42_5810 [Sphaceloma murrayae]|uniref:C3H1-type domain-containing protein n=1 Tax=Sphaceloma murrayae TaxID=2082308 RepID=A0A2K1QZD6_9PEZI|nr:hypothetical protein CAC42_5810 [Sphaceloma murrayae]